MFTLAKTLRDAYEADVLKPACKAAAKPATKPIPPQTFFVMPAQAGTHPTR